MSNLIKCRAQLGSGCQHREEDLAQEIDVPVWRDDRSYDPTSDTIVCDWCFINLPDNGRFKNLDELAELIATAMAGAA